MQQDILNNINIINEKILITPKKLKENFPIHYKVQKIIQKSRKKIINIINKKDHRLLIVCGPCSIHDPNAALEYAKSLKDLSEKFKDTLYIVMRAYFEKPRTTLGWKGLINDPYMDNSFDMESGLTISRKLLIKLVNIGLPLAQEALDPNTPQYLGDLFSWAAIGARTTESQTHREMASGLSMPVGFKNSTDGSFNTAVNAIHAASMPHHFVGINQSGQVCLLHTRGNLNGHVILRGGKFPNYDEKNVKKCEIKMMNSKLRPVLMIDCSHGNSNKNYLFQTEVAKSVIQQIKNGNKSIIGLMFESNLYEGNQLPNIPFSKLKYGISVTDACINLKTTQNILEKIHLKLKNILKNRL